jgi:hypothetical protein
MTNAVINIATDTNPYIYRIVPVARLFELFAERKNVLVAPHKWDDPYENLRRRLEPEAVGYRVYGQCWTLHSASDAMWRIYSPSFGRDSAQSAVRIRSTIQTLFNSLHAGSRSTDSVFIGKIQYLPTAELLKRVKRSLSSKGPRAVAESILVKRPAFRHEGEVRLIVVSQHSSNDLYRYSFDSHLHISQIMTDPRLDQSQSRKLKDEIVSRTGFSGEIKRSLLYSPPDL